MRALPVTWPSGAGFISASALVVAAGLLATVPLTTAIGNLTDDPGIEIGVQAGIAQSGTVVLLFEVHSQLGDQVLHAPILPRGV